MTVIVTDTGHGTLYTSDATGIVFSESLQKHLYPNFEAVTDFYKVTSMRGVYIANTIDDEQSISTMITFNRGADWRPIKKPDNAPCYDNTKVHIVFVFNCIIVKQFILVVR